MEFSPAPLAARNTSHGGDETLTVLEAARRAGVTQSAIIRWIRNGYLSATPSSEGWQIPAGMLAEASQVADEARGTGPVPRATSPTLAPAPTPIRHSLERRSSSLSAGDVSEQIVTPLAELIRDQIDVVHDQAEVIGWLQAERSRLSSELERLQTSLTEGHEPDSHDKQPDEDTLDLSNDSELYDEVLSLLWKDADAPRLQGTPAEDRWADPFDEHAPEEAALAASPAAPRINEAISQQPGLNVEDYADPSWFFGNRNGKGETREKAEQPRAVLQPIVPRPATPPPSDEDQALHRMIDETERKIADLWRNEEQLRNTPRVAIERDHSGHHSIRNTMWQRLWPLRR